MAKIVHIENGVTREYTLGEVPITVGRAARHTIPTMDSRASRDHFKVELLNGSWMAADLGSRNGTLLNGELLAHPRALRPGDKLMIGAAVFQFLDGTITTPAPEPPLVPSHTTRDVAAAVEKPPPAPAPPPMPPRPEPSFVEVLVPGGSATTYPLGATAVVIGRARECNIPLEDEKLSSRHAEITETDQGIAVRDLKSTNGTKFDGQSFESRLFRDREKFTAGAVTFRILSPRFPSLAKPASKPRRPGPVVLAVVAALVVLGGVARVAPSLIGKLVDIPPPSPPTPITSWAKPAPSNAARKAGPSQPMPITRSPPTPTTIRTAALPSASAASIPANTPSSQPPPAPSPLPRALPSSSKAGSARKPWKVARG
jgi:pSer/pThr/pTyr-binding forkhead associated (FHA) protein